MRLRLLHGRLLLRRGHLPVLPDQGFASCGTTGLCNGGGNCARYDISTECMTSCDATTLTATHTFCDGAGQCGGLSLLEPCQSLMCTAANAGCAP